MWFNSAQYRSILLTGAIKQEKALIRITLLLEGMAGMIQTMAWHPV